MLQAYFKAYVAKPSTDKSWNIVYRSISRVCVSCGKNQKRSVAAPNWFKMLCDILRTLLIKTLVRRQEPGVTSGSKLYASFLNIAKRGGNNDTISIYRTGSTSGQTCNRKWLQYDNVPYCIYLLELHIICSIISFHLKPALILSNICKTHMNMYPYFSNIQHYSHVWNKNNWICIILKAFRSNLLN